MSTEGSPFHHNECEQRAVLCWSFGAMGGRLLHSTPRLHAFQILRPHITAVAHTSLTPRKAVLHFCNHPFPFKQACLLGTHVWQVRSAFGGHLCSHRDTSTGPNNYTHTSVLMYTHHSHPGKHSHIFSHHPFPFSRPVLYVQGHALVVKIGLLFWGPLVHIQGTPALVPTTTPHTSVLMYTHHIHTQGSTHTFFHTTPSLSAGLSCTYKGNALVVKIGLLFWGPLVHIQGHLHWSQQLHPHISADVHTSLTPREALTHFFTPPLPFQQACLVRTRARTGSKDRSAFLGATCAHTGTPCTGPNNYTHTSVLMYTHHSHPGKHSHIFSHHPFPFSRPVLYVQGHALVVKIGLLFWGPLVHIQGHLHWSQQLHPHISADVHTSLTPREALTTFFHTTPSLSAGLSCTYKGTHW